jgi:hypothetical protein
MVEPHGMLALTLRQLDVGRQAQSTMVQLRSPCGHEVKERVFNDKRAKDYEQFFECGTQVAGLLSAADIQELGVCRCRERF